MYISDLKNVMKLNRIQIDVHHMNIPDGDKPWRDHLMGADGCVKNPRRIQALKKSNKKINLETSIDFFYFLLIL